MRGFGWKTPALILIIALPLMVGCFPPTITGGGVAIGVGGVANGHIVGPGHRIRFPLTVTYPRTVTIYVDGHGLDPTVSVYNAGGGRLAFNDDGGAGLDAQLVLPMAPGNYIVEVGGYGSSMGPFTLTIN